MSSCRSYVSLFLILGTFTAAAEPNTAETVFDIADRDVVALIDAISASNRSRDVPHRIRLAPDGLYTLLVPHAPALGLPALEGQLVIEGRGAEIRAWTDRPMSLVEVAASGTVEIRDLSLAEANLGALTNFGNLVLKRLRVTDSQAEGGRGILVNYGEMRAEHCEFAHNQIQLAGRDAGTVVNYGRLQLSHSEIHGNRVSRRYPTLASAGALLNHGRLHLSSLRAHDNDIVDAYGGLAFESVLNLQGGIVKGVVSSSMLREE